MGAFCRAGAHERCAHSQFSCICTCHRAPADPVGVCIAMTPEGVCEWPLRDHTALEPVWQQRVERLARWGAYRDGEWHAFDAEPKQAALAIGAGEGRGRE